MLTDGSVRRITLIAVYLTADDWRPRKMGGDLSLSACSCKEALNAHLQTMLCSDVGNVGKLILLMIFVSFPADLVSCHSRGDRGHSFAVQVEGQ